MHAAVVELLLDELDLKVLKLHHVFPIRSAHGAILDAISDQMVELNLNVAGYFVGEGGEAIRHDIAPKFISTEEDILLAVVLNQTEDVVLLKFLAARQESEFDDESGAHD